MFGLRDENIDAINSCFRRYKSIDEVLIYGSRAKGNFRNGSDIDLTIISNDLKFSELLRLENEIDDLLLPYKVDLSVKRGLTNSELLDHIDRVGKVFYKKT